jgi:TolB protein
MGQETRKTEHEAHETLLPHPIGPGGGRDRPAGALPSLAQEPPRIDITVGVIEPMPFAAPVFVDEGGAGELARDLSRVVVSDLVGTGFFREIPEDAHIGRITSFDGGVAFEDWRAVNAQVLIAGAVRSRATGSRSSSAPLTW